MIEKVSIDYDFVIVLGFLHNKTMISINQNEHLIARLYRFININKSIKTSIQLIKADKKQ